MFFIGNIKYFLVHYIVCFFSLILLMFGKNDTKKTSFKKDHISISISEKNNKDSTILLNLCDNLKYIKKNNPLFKDSSIFVCNTDTIIEIIRKDTIVGSKQYRDIQIKNNKTVLFKRYLRQSHDTLFQLSTCNSDEYVLFIFSFTNNLRNQKRICFDLEEGLETSSIYEFKQCGYNFYRCTMSIAKYSCSHCKTDEKYVEDFIIEKHYGIVGIGVANNSITGYLDFFYLPSMR